MRWERLSRSRDIWSFYGIWQDFAGIPSHMVDGIDDDSSRHGSAFRRNLLLTIDVLPFLSIASDTPKRQGACPDRQGRVRIAGARCRTGARSSRPWSSQLTQLCGRRRTATLCGGMMPFVKVEKSLNEGC